MLIYFSLDEIRKMHPKQIKKLLDETRAFISKSNSEGIYHLPTEEMLFSRLKKCLDELPNIPNKQEARLIRQEKAKKRK